MNSTILQSIRQKAGTSPTSILMSIRRPKAMLEAWVAELPQKYEQRKDKERKNRNNRGGQTVKSLTPV
ncbi:MAG: hypothetical protein ABGZ53_32030 [Fuerstiella sp.]|jgi:hypothetical protein